MSLVRRWIDMTWVEADSVARDHAVVILPVGAVEAHGPHLPLGTDVIIAEQMAEAGGQVLSDAGLDAFILPTLAYSTAPFAADFSGTISIAADTATALICDIAVGLAGRGFECLAIANAHLDPSHIGSIRAAVDRINSGGVATRGLVAVFPDVTRKPWALRLTDEFKSGACHAGRYESSIVMAARPDLVKNTVRAGLEANPVSLSVAIRDGKSSFVDAGGPQAYFGDPAAAGAEEGRQTIATLGSILADAVIEHRR
jgi:creatinine amidohydrolase